MSKKKYKKRHPQYGAPSAAASAQWQAEEAARADERARNRKRLKPTARVLLFGNLIFLCASQILEKKEMISDFVSGLASITGILVLVLVLWIQFHGKGGNSQRLSGSEGGPRLR